MCKDHEAWFKLSYGSSQWALFGVWKTNRYTNMSAILFLVEGTRNLCFYAQTGLSHMGFTVAQPSDCRISMYRLPCCWKGPLGSVGPGTVQSAL